MTDFSVWMRQLAEHTEVALNRVLPDTQYSPARLHEAMRYACLGGGKRIRPLLVYAAGMCVDAPLEVLEVPACAIEMVHVYSLVHDDLPCMDDDDLRRGRLTVHKAFDEATALLVGDALQTQAFICLSEASVLPEIKNAWVIELAKASGSLGMAGGQAIDLESVGLKLNRDALETMHRMKTGALLRAAVRLGAMSMGSKALSSEILTRLDAYAAAVGLAFQVVDDVLDASADTATLGKTAGKDAAADKPTYVSLLGLDAARRLAEELRETALVALAPLDARADALRYLAERIVVRSH
jgi:farnesyl diphosphate synthase